MATLLLIMATLIKQMKECLTPTVRKDTDYHLKESSHI